LFLQTCLAFIVALASGVVAVRFYPSDGLNWTFAICYLSFNALLVTAYLLALRRLYSFTNAPRLQWFIVRGTIVDPIAATFVMALLLALFMAGSGSNPRDADYLFVFYPLLWFLDLVLVGHHFTDLRPFIRGESAAVPWPYYDGKANCPEAVFFRMPPEWLGEVVSAGSSFRGGEELPPLRGALLLAFWGGALGCLLCVSLLYASGIRDFPQLVFVLPIYGMIGSIAAAIQLFRQRICSYVGTLGAVQFKLEADGALEVWSVLFSDFQHLKRATDHYYKTGLYNGTSETRRFENADGSVTKEYSFNWNNPVITRAAPDVLPDVQHAFWNKIETVWANRELE
ncbi:MAG: hypothetical protein HXX17_16630, partial [Geobacteraceae bacterium]|nr:hypothetical protein [Geobacteraceae bacterium]